MTTSIGSEAVLKYLEINKKRNLKRERKNKGNQKF